MSIDPSHLTTVLNNHINGKTPKDASISLGNFLTKVNFVSTVTYEGKKIDFFPLIEPLSQVIANLQQLSSNGPLNPKKPISIQNISLKSEIDNNHRPYFKLSYTIFQTLNDNFLKNLRRRLKDPPDSRQQNGKNIRFTYTCEWCEDDLKPNAKAAPNQPEPGEYGGEDDRAYFIPNPSPQDDQKPKATPNRSDSGKSYVIDDEKAYFNPESNILGALLLEDLQTLKSLGQQDWYTGTTDRFKTGFKTAIQEFEQLVTNSEDPNALLNNIKQLKKLNKDLILLLHPDKNPLYKINGETNEFFRTNENIKSKLAKFDNLSRLISTKSDLVAKTNDIISRERNDFEALSTRLTDFKKTYEELKAILEETNHPETSSDNTKFSKEAEQWIQEHGEALKKEAAKMMEEVKELVANSITRITKKEVELLNQKIADSINENIDFYEAIDIAETSSASLEKIAECLYQLGLSGDECYQIVFDAKQIFDGIKYSLEEGS